MNHLKTVRSRGRLAACALSLGLLAVPAAAQDSTYTVLQSGASLPGFGFGVGRVDRVHVDLSGRWLALVSTSDTLSTRIQMDQAWMDSSGVFQAESSAVATPSGATVDGWGAIDTDDAGNVFQLLYLSGGGATGTDDLGLYRNGVLMLRENGAVAASGVTAGTRYENFLNFRVNGAGSQILIAAVIDDPAIPSPEDVALVRITLNSTTGQIQGQAIVAKEGDVLPGQTRAVETLGTGYHQIAINDLGSVMFIADLVGDVATDGVIYLDSTVIAQEGGTSFNPARTWGVLTGHSLDLNDLGDYIFQATLDSSDPATDRVLATNGAIFKAEGDALRGLPPIFRAKNFGPANGPVRIDDAGHLFWFVEIGSTGGERAIFYDDTLKVREDFQSVAGAVFRDLHNGPGAWSVSDNNQIIALSGTNNDGVRRVVILDTGPAAAATDVPQVTPAGLQPFLTGGPNPFTSSVEVRFAIARESDVRLEAFDVSGRRVADLVTGPRAAGEYRVTWDGRDRKGHPVAPGVYFLRLRAADEVLQARVVRIQ